MKQRMDRISARISRGRSPAMDWVRAIGAGAGVATGEKGAAAGEGNGIWFGRGGGGDDGIELW